MAVSPPRKKLIEVSIPLEAINEEALRRKQKAPKGISDCDPQMVGSAADRYMSRGPVCSAR